MTNLIIRNYGLISYKTTLQLMQDFTNQRTSSTPDELWFLEHHPVFTQGQTGKPEHLLNPGLIPVVQSDRGGQTTYHGPGQLVIYLLLDLKRKNLGIKSLITSIEQAIITLLASYDITGNRKFKAPGVYVNHAKIAALGIRVRRGCSYHGLSLNVKMDLEPFSRINPCGYPGLQVIQMQDFNVAISTADVALRLVAYLRQHLDYPHIIIEEIKRI